ncbi:unnamed protein product [Sympodiomycopsis kandeliae]
MSHNSHRNDAASDQVLSQDEPDEPSGSSSQRLERIALAIEGLTRESQANRLYNLKHLGRIASALETQNQRQEGIAASQKIGKAANAVATVICLELFLGSIFSQWKIMAEHQELGAAGLIRYLLREFLVWVWTFVRGCLDH